MINKKEKEQDVNLIESSTKVFVDYYNENIPDSFPRASLKTLNEFQVLHPSLFKDNKDWTIKKHRKKVMDWLFSHHED
jgi:hypothetical protein